MPKPIILGSPRLGQPQDFTFFDVYHDIIVFPQGAQYRVPPLNRQLPLEAKDPRMMPGNWVVIIPMNGDMVPIRKGTYFRVSLDLLMYLPDGVRHITVEYQVIIKALCHKIYCDQAKEIHAREKTAEQYRIYKPRCFEKKLWDEGAVEDVREVLWKSRT